MTDRKVTGRKRPDRAKHKADIKSTKNSVVKTTLRAFCKPAGTALPWGSVIEKINRAALEAYMFANMHVLRVMTSGLPVPRLDQNFMYRCCSVTSCPSKKESKSTFDDQDMQDTIMMYDALRPPGQVPECSDYLGAGLFNNLSQQMETNLKNHAALNFYQRFRRYLKLALDFDGTETYNFLQLVFSPEYTGTQPLVLRYRSMFPAVPTETAISRDPRIVLPVLHEIQRFYDRHPFLEGTSRFSLLPLKKGFTTSYIKVCTTSLHSILRLAGGGSGITIPGRTDFVKQADTFWRHLFHIDAYETGCRQFDHEILTDGKAVSIVMRRQIPTAASTDPRQMSRREDCDKVWGLDPGVRDMYVASSTEGEISKCSSREFYEDSSYTCSNKKISTWVKTDQDVSALTAALPSARTGRLAAFQEHVKYVLENMSRLRTFYGAWRFRNLKLKRFIHARKKLRALCKRLAGDDGSKTLVGFGDWSLKTAAGVVKGCKPGPSSRFRKELAKHCKVIDVDEYLTSKTCHVCHGKLRNMMARVFMTDKTAGKRSYRKVHAVQHCSTSDCLCTTVNRDINASHNMLNLMIWDLENRPRPKCFSRKQLS